MLTSVNSKGQNLNENNQTDFKDQGGYEDNNNLVVMVVHTRHPVRHNTYTYIKSEVVSSRPTSLAVL